MDETERRAAKRFEGELKGTATFDIEGKEEQREVTIKNISVYGAYFQTDTCPDISESVRIHMQLEDSEAPFEAVGTVIRVDQLSEKRYGCALKFEETLGLGCDGS
ncbi:PilZ domain-containing protein [Acidobacteria bacterium AH-259-L09]|nr:PilZ domain-containing protein [Acidobacteria bacterium AH-259-L09]